MLGANPRRRFLYDAATSRYAPSLLHLQPWSRSGSCRAFRQRRRYGPVGERQASRTSLRQRTSKSGVETLCGPPEDLLLIRCRKNRQCLLCFGNEPAQRPADGRKVRTPGDAVRRSEEHTSELQSIMRISYAAFCLTTTTTIRKARTRS